MNSTIDAWQLGWRRRHGTLLCCIGLLISSSSASSGDWRLSKQLSLKGTYTDNLNIDNSSGGRGGKGDFYVEFTPGLVLQGQGRRLNLDFVYSPQFVHYMSHSSEDKVNHRLHANANAELYRNHIFLDLSMTARQELINSQGSYAWDASNPSANLQTTYTYLIAPSFKNRFGRFADMMLRLEQDGVFYSDQGSDSLGYRTQFNLTSGPVLGDLRLGVSTETEDVSYQDGGPDDRFRKVMGNVGYQWDKRWRLDTFGGYEENNYSSLQRTSGSIWEALVSWTPNPRTSVKVGYGERYFGSTPHLEVNYRRKRSVWSASYVRDISSARNDRRLAGVYKFQDAFGEQVTPETGTSVEVPLDTATPNTSVYVSDRFQGAVAVKTRRSAGGLALGYIMRDYQNLSRRQEDLDARAYWSRRLAKHLSLNLSVGWNRQETDLVATRRDYYYFRGGFTQQLSEQAFFDVSYGLRDESDSGVENRLSVGLRMAWK